MWCGIPLKNHTRRNALNSDKWGSEPTGTGLAWPLAMWHSLDLPRSLDSTGVACWRLILRPRRRRESLAADHVEMKSPARCLAGEGRPSKCPGLVDIAFGSKRHDRTNVWKGMKVLCMRMLPCAFLHFLGGEPIAFRQPIMT